MDVNKARYKPSTDSNLRDTYTDRTSTIEAIDLIDTYPSTYLYLRTADKLTVEEVTSLNVREMRKILYRTAIRETASSTPRVRAVRARVVEEARV